MADKNCTDALHELYHFLDGEMTDEKRSAVQHHLEQCPPCFEAYDFEAELKEVVQAKCRERVPESLRTRIADAIGHPTTPDADLPDPMPGWPVLTIYPRHHARSRLALLDRRLGRRARGRRDGRHRRRLPQEGRLAPLPRQALTPSHG